MGKANLLRHARMYVDGYNLSGDARSVDGLMDSYEEVDLTAWIDAAKWAAADQGMRGITGFKALMNNDSGTFDTLKTGGDGKVVSFLFGVSAAPVVGSIAYVLHGAQMSAAPGFDGKAGVIQADFLPGDSYNGDPMGVVLSHPTASISVTTTGASVDNAVATINGYHANLHIIATSSGDYEFTLEHSTNGSDWSTLATFTQDGSAIGAEYIGGTGTVNRYVRLVSTKTGGSCWPICAFARN